MSSESPVSGPAPAVILVNPQLGENIGTAARAMANFGLGDLRLVAPRFGWPNTRADALAAGAFGEGGVEARVFDDVPAATGDLSFLLAATARPRETPKPVLGPREAVAACRARLSGEGTGGAGVMFGAETTSAPNPGRQVTP